MRFTNVSMCAAALGAALLTGCSAVGGMAGMAGAGGAGTSEEMASGAPTAGETAGNVAIQAAATESLKKSGIGGSIGYGLQNHGASLSRSLFGKKKAQPKQQPEAPAQ